MAAVDTIDALRTEVEKAEHALKTARDERDRLGSLLTDHHREVQALDANLAALDLERETHLEDTPKELEAIRGKRRELAQKRDDLTTEMTLLESKVGQAQQEQVQALAALHIATRRKVQAEGAAVSQAMRATISKLEQSFDRWLALAREDQQSKDMLLGIVSNNSDGSTTYSWNTAVDATFAETIMEVVRRKDQAESELRVRERQAVAVG